MSCLLCQEKIDFEEPVNHCLGCDIVLCSNCSTEVEKCPYCRKNYYNDTPIIEFDVELLFKKLLTSKHHKLIYNKLGLYYVETDNYSKAKEYFLQSPYKISKDNLVILYKLGLIKSFLDDKLNPQFKYLFFQKEIDQKIEFKIRSDSLCDLGRFFNNFFVKKFAEYGYHHAQYRFATIKNYYPKAEDLSWLYKAALNGSDLACIKLYNSDNKNIFWLEMASERGYGKASFVLYEYYRNKKDDKMMKYLRKALDQKYKRAAYEFAYLELQNSLQSAYKYYLLGAELSELTCNENIITLKDILKKIDILPPLEPPEVPLEPRMQAILGPTRVSFGYEPPQGLLISNEDELTIIY